MINLACVYAMAFLYQFVLLPSALSVFIELVIILSPLQVHIGYLPNKQVLGLSKLAR